MCDKEGEIVVERRLLACHLKDENAREDIDGAVCQNDRLDGIQSTLFINVERGDDVPMRFFSSLSAAAKWKRRTPSEVSSVSTWRYESDTELTKVMSRCGTAKRSKRRRSTRANSVAMKPA